MKIIKSVMLGLILVGAVSADEISQPGHATQRNDGWPVGTLEQTGFDVSAMQSLTEKLLNDDYSNAHAVIVEYDGKLVYEQYLHGTDQNWGSSIGSVQYDYDIRHDLRSISKSVTALLLGIALGDDLHSALSKPVLEYLPGYTDIATPDFQKITLHHVLTMTAGFEWNEMDIPYSNSKNDEIQLYYNTGDPINFIIKKPQKTNPGTEWYYNGGTTMLLAAIVSSISNQPFLEFAEQRLFEPLGISDYEWHGERIWNKGYPAAASGLRLRARDLAKIGSLMLHGGRWQGKQIVPAEWVEASFVRHTEQTNDEWSYDGVYGYTYQWWHGKFTGDWGNFTALAGLGYGGQRLYIVPEKNMVVTVFAGNYGTGNWKMPERILSDIVAASP